MNRLATTIAKLIEDKVARYADGSEVRLIFHGPPDELLREVYETLTRDNPSIPVLLQVPKLETGEKNPPIGVSGTCDDTHLLDLRNSPSDPAFLALVPPGLHSMRSVTSTADEFGIAPDRNGTNATFEEWWSDDFIQDLVKIGLEAVDVEDTDFDGAEHLARAAFQAADDMDRERTRRKEAWLLLSRLYSIAEEPAALSPGDRVSLAFGVPPTGSGGISAKEQLSVLGKIADALADGFGPGIQRASTDASESDVSSLEAFRDYLRLNCELPTSFERATAYFYSPTTGLAIEDAPDWWRSLTVEKWSQLLVEDSPAQGDIRVTCSNSLVELGKGMPSLVESEVELAFETDSADAQEVLISINRGSKTIGELSMDFDGATFIDEEPPAHKTPTRYVAAAEGCKPGALKVVSLTSWQPGIFVACRLARKMTPPRKPRSRSSNDLEANLTLPGKGRYELMVFSSPGVEVEPGALGFSEDTESQSEEKQELTVHKVRDGLCHVEAEADSNYRVEIYFSRQDGSGRAVTQSLAVNLVIEDVPEQGCRNELERLILLNRRSVEKSEKLFVQVDRTARSTNLQDWMLSPDNAAFSYQPVVIADDYVGSWLQPEWGNGKGPIFSDATFLHDPRPDFSEFQAPSQFIAAREKLAKRIRGEDQNGLAETAELGKWSAIDTEFAELVEEYVSSYNSWLSAQPDTACWCDVALVCSLDGGKRTIERVPEAVLLSPLHPLRIGWHVIAQRALVEADEAGQPCPAVSVLDPDCVPDLLTLAMRSPSGLEKIDFLAVENGTDYWSVLWNGDQLKGLPTRSARAPFGADFGITVGGITAGFSAGQVSRALDDVSSLLSAKPSIGIVIDSAEGTSDSCNEGLVDWSGSRFGAEVDRKRLGAAGLRTLEIYDHRDARHRPDDATIANLSEDTDNKARWFDGQPSNTTPDLGIIAQLDMAEPSTIQVEGRSPLGYGGLLRHRVRRQLPGAYYISETRQSRPTSPSDDALANKVASGLARLENLGEKRSGMQFAPNVHAIQNMFNVRQAQFVAASSSAIDPGSFLGGWLEGAYLWDYDLPSYSRRSGDTNGYYLLSRIKPSDEDALCKAVSRLPGCASMGSEQIRDMLLEIARRGIPTVRGLSGDNSGSTGDLGLFVAARLLQDRFRQSGPRDSIVPIFDVGAEETTLCLIVPVDPFRGYFSDLAKSLPRGKTDLSLSRPDLLAVGVKISEDKVRIHLTPIEVKCRPDSTFPAGEVGSALEQAKTFSRLLERMLPHEDQPVAWRLGFQHLLLTIINFGMRVYSQNPELAGKEGTWAGFHEQIAAAILDSEKCISVDQRGRLMIIDASPSSKPRDTDGDGFDETITIGSSDAGAIIAGDTRELYEQVSTKIGHWELFPPAPASSDVVEPADDPVQPTPAPVHLEPSEEIATTNPYSEPEDEPTPSPAVLISKTQDETVMTEGVRLQIGKPVDAFSSEGFELNISNTRLNQLNMGVVGDLGTGKTQLLKSLIYQISRSESGNRGTRPRVLIFDYKRDYSSPEFVEATGARVVKPYRLPLNLFDTRSIGESNAPWLDRYRFFTDVLDKIYSGIGPVQRQKLKQAIQTAYASCFEGQQPTLYDVHSAYAAILDGRTDSPMSIIDDLVDMEVFAPSSSETVPFEEFLDGVVVISLDALGQDDRSKNMLVAVMLNMFYENMLKTPKKPYVGTDPQLRAIDSFLLVDEADNIMQFEFDVLRKLLLQGREFGTGVILASQYLRHFKVSATDYREPLLTWFIHKVPNITPAELSALGLVGTAAEAAERIKSLEVHECLYKSYDVPGDIIRGKPFFELQQEDLASAD